MSAPVQSVPPTRHEPPTSNIGIASSISGILFPLLVLAAATALLTSFAALLGWYVKEMLAIDMVASTVVLLVAAALTFLRVTVKRQTARALHDTEERLGAIVDTAMDAIISMDESHKVVLFNNAAEKLFGRPRAQVIGETLEMLIPQRHRETHTRHVARFGATGVTQRRMGDQTVLLALRANGEEFPIEASISQQGEPGHKLYTVILRDISERVQAEQALRQSREEVRELAAVSQSAREEEKARVARELHDEIGGALTALKMDASWLGERLPAGEAALAIKLAGMQKILDNTVAATRRMSSNLRPMMLDDLGLVAAVEWLTHDFQTHSGIVCELAIGMPEIDLPQESATAVFRILQESLTNIAKHAKASHAEITLDIDDDELILTVHDNGVGFNTSGARPQQSYGILGIRERVSLLSGQVFVESTPGKGTVVEVKIPLKSVQQPT
ncbi:MAG: PAS domain S-box protein [Burkholderiales bacterium]